MSKRTRNKKIYKECEHNYKKNYCSCKKMKHCLIRFLIRETLKWNRRTPDE